MSKTTTKPETLGIPELSASLAEAHDLTKARAKAILDSLRDEIVQALLAGDVDMVLTDAASGRGYIGANPDKLKIVGGPLGAEDFGFIFKQGSDLVKPFNAAIATMKKDGFLEHLNTRWFYMYDASSK